MSMNNEELARKAANWWREAYNRPRFDNGDNSLAGGVAVLAALMMSDKPSAEVGDKFEEELYNSILKHLDKTDGDMYISTDYAPDGTLSNACNASGMNINNTPWKTSMTISNGKVVVCPGYGSSSIEI